MEQQTTAIVFPIESRDSTRAIPTVKQNSPFAFVLMISAIIYLIAGTMSLFTWFTLTVHNVFPDLARQLLINSMSGIVSSVLVIASSRALAGGKLLAIWLFAGGILIEFFGKFMANGMLDYSILGIGVFVLWQMQTLRKQHKLI